MHQLEPSISYLSFFSEIRIYLLLANIYNGEHKLGVYNKEGRDSWATTL